MYWQSSPRGPTGAATTAERPKSFLAVPSAVPVKHPVWNHTGRRTVQGDPDKLSKPAGDPVLHRFFHSRRCQRGGRHGKRGAAKPTTPQRKIVGVGHCGTFLVTSDGHPSSMPEGYQTSPPDRPLLSYAKNGSGEGLARRWADDPELTARRLDQHLLHRQLGHPQLYGGNHRRSHHHDDAAAADGRGSSRRTGSSEGGAWKPMTVADVLPLGTSDDGDSGYGDDADADGDDTLDNTQQQAVAEIQESYARALAGSTVDLADTRRTAADGGVPRPIGESRPHSDGSVNHGGAGANGDRGATRQPLSTSATRTSEGGTGASYLSPDFAVKLLRQIRTSAASAPTATTAATAAPAPQVRNVAALDGDGSASGNGSFDEQAVTSLNGSERDFATPQGDSSSRRFRHRKASLLGFKGKTPVRCVWGVCRTTFGRPLSSARMRTGRCAPVPACGQCVRWVD
jgi:hypothetical protein